MTGFKRTNNQASCITPQVQQIREFAFKNPDRFIQTQLKVVDKKAGVVPFHYNYTQQRIAEIIKDEEKARRPLRLYILKSRRVGSSTMVTYRHFVHAWAHNNLYALVLAQLEERSEELVSRVKFCYAALAPELRIPLCQDNKYGMQFKDTLSKITIASARNLDAARGPTYQRLILTEFAYYKKAREVLTEFLQPMVFDPSTEAIIETTGRGYGSDAHDLWQRSRAGKSAFRAEFMAWQDDPECTYEFENDKDRDCRLAEAFDYEPRLKDRMQTYKLTPGNIYYSYIILKNVIDGDWAKYLIDYPCDEHEPWQSRQLSYFGTENVNRLRIATSEFPYQYRVFPEGMAIDETIPDKIDSFEKLERVDRLDENADRPFFKVWAYPRSNSEYVGSGDSSEGLQGGDFSSTFIIDMYTFEQMCEFHGKVRPDQHGYVMAMLGNIYNQALLAPEINPPGNVTFMTLSSCYNNIYRYKHPYMDNVNASKNATRHLAWQTNTTSRPTMLALGKRVAEDLANDRLRMAGIIKSRELVNEMGTFSPDEGTGKPEAIPGANDDRVMSWCIAIEVARQEIHGTDMDILSLYKRDPDLGPAPTMDATQMTLDPSDVIRNFNEMWVNDNRQWKSHVGYYGF
jgi:hypothetical protein